MRNICFFKNNQLIQHDSTQLSSALLISITFEDQNNREKNQAINLHRSRDDVLCPVRSWCKTVKRIWSYQGASRDFPVNLFQLEGKSLRITNTNVLRALRSTVESMQERFNLGFTSEEIGTHSIRSGEQCC